MLNMGRRKGEPNAGTKNLIPLNQRTPEERSAIAKKSVEARRKKKEETLALQKCMRTLLTMRTNSDKQKQVLKKFGFSEEELTNKTILMVVLFQKGLAGDVGAIKEITQMMDKLDLFEKTGNVSNNITINLVAEGEQYQPNEKDEQEIWDVENNTDWMEEEAEEEWGTDVYKG